MDEQVGIAPDRRGEVAVGGAAEPGVAAVALAVGGLLEGAEHERCIRLAAVPAPRGLAADEPARLGRHLARLRGESPARSGGVGTPSACSWAISRSIRAGSGWAWTR